MAYLYTPPTNTTNLDQAVIQVAQAVPPFIPMLMAFVWFVVFLGGIGLQKLRTGTADYPMWSVVASLATFMLTMLMSVKSGLINLEWLVVVIVITIFSAVWFFLSSRPGEL